MQNTTAHTQKHYDDYPFIQGGEQRVIWWQDYLSKFWGKEVLTNQLLLDVGCGAGEISHALGKMGANVTGLDISAVSLEESKKLNSTHTHILGNALELPFPDESFNHSLSIGVLHHTPDCHKGFNELARVTKVNGEVTVFLYQYWNIYHLIYKLTWPLRLIPLSKVPKFFAHSLQPFAWLHFKRFLSTDQIFRLLGDKLWTPKASFHSTNEVKAWGEENNLRLIRKKMFFLAYATLYHFKKLSPKNE